jgi:hypothetical protein
MKIPEALARKLSNFPSVKMELWLTSSLIAILQSIVFFGSPANAQVPGTFFPTALGEVQEGFTPFPQAAPEDLPYLETAPIQLESEMSASRRPYLNLVSSYANQSLLEPQGQLDTFTPAMSEFGFFPHPQAEVKLSYIPTIFGRAALRGPRVFGNEYRVTTKWQPTERLKLAGQLGLYQWYQSKAVSGGLDVLGAVSASYAVHDRVQLTGGYRRDILGNTLLSATGLNLVDNGALVGRVKQNLFYIIADFRPEKKTSLSLFYSGGVETGSKINGNGFQQGSLFLSRPLYSAPPTRHLSIIAPSYQFLIFNWNKDYSGIGNLALQVQPPNNPVDRFALIQSSRAGETSVDPDPQPRVGGYFSPKAFMINAVNLNVAGRVAGPVYYRGGVGYSVTNSKNTFSKFSKVSPGYFANAALTYRFGKRAVQEHGWYFVQGENVYRRNVVY